MKKLISSVLIVTTILLAGVTASSQPVGAQTHQVAQKDNQEKKLKVSEDDKVILGVCGGIAEYLGIDSGMVRILAVVGLFFAGATFWIYIISWFIMS